MVGRNLVTARLLARRGVVDPTDFTSLLAWRLESGGSSGGFNGVITEVLMEEQSVTADEAYVFLDAMKNVPTGSNLVVTFDGTKYACKPWFNELNEICYGNGNLLGSPENGNDMPFALNAYLDSDWMTFEEFIAWYWIPENADGSAHTIKIERETVIPKTVLTITGEEPFTFQSANNTVYYKNSDFINVPHENIVYAHCTHFEWGSGAVIADMKDGQFIFNYTKSSGIGTGNVSFKRDDLFTGTSAAKEWFKAQAENGTPVTITVYVKN